MSVQRFIKVGDAIHDEWVPGEEAEKRTRVGWVFNKTDLVKKEPVVKDKKPQKKTKKTQAIKDVN